MSVKEGEKKLAFPPTGKRLTKETWSCGTSELILQPMFFRVTWAAEKRALSIRRDRANMNLSHTAKTLLWVNCVKGLKGNRFQSKIQNNPQRRFAYN